MEILKVFDTLTVGPVKVEKNRISAPYRLSYQGKEESTQFIYKYEEDVFDPEDDVSQNLASIMTAQVALNYGLFCKKILFVGTSDDTDRKFIADMAENTAREILVKKFLQPNPFLVGEAARLIPWKMEKYCQAELEFEDFPVRIDKTKWQLWSTERRRHAILSSGGKDSLLTFALLNEMGKEVHPIFVNESGRHWFTALNAFNHFKQNVPHTCRVWTNSDRVFNWMLRQMPFIRKDYSNLRSDDYPIRLWTVAVFLFGAIPLVRKRQIGRILIGDEFDTTVRTYSQGIPHYDGLYDQSRYFDNALSRYYLRKGWAVNQFSILRPLSEMLIEKILAERYPDLLKLQMSCHAAHKEGERIKACGRCEKCRRIVGMLSAIGANAGLCGYNQNQIEDCLNLIKEKGLHQEAAGISQLKFMLMDRGLLHFNQSEKKSIREKPEILKLRFDPERSPLDSIPLDLRKFLYEVYLTHARGAVSRVGRDWKDFDPLADPAIHRPYAFDLEMEKKNKTSSRASSSPIKSYLWGELTWPEAQQRFTEVDIALLPVGSIEQHGLHLPLDTDAFDAEYLATRVAKACSSPKPLVLPLIPYGVSYEHSEFKGTISISNRSLSNLVYDIGMSVAQNGIKKLVIINAHGGNMPALNYAAQMINREAKIFVCVDSGETSDIDIARIADTPNDVHAGEIETSTSLAVRPQLVNMDRAIRSVPEFSSRYLNFTSRRGVLWYAYTKNVSPDGVIGDATKATAQKGRRIWQAMIAHLVTLVEDIKSMTLDELHHRKY